MCCNCGEESEPEEDIPKDAETGPTSLYDRVSREERDLEPSVPNVITGRRRRIRRLHCRTGFDLAVYPNGKVRGTKSPRNKYGLLEFEPAGMQGELRIKGTATGFYVTMTPKGRVVAQPLSSDSGTVWIETRVATVSTFMSLLSQDHAHKGWYLAIKKSGKPKAGHKTNHPYPQKATSFLTRIITEEFN